MNKSVKALVCVLVVSVLVARLKKRQHSMFMMARSYIANYISNTLLSRKQTLKKRSTLTVVQDT